MCTAPTLVMGHGTLYLDVAMTAGATSDGYDWRARPSARHQHAHHHQQQQQQQQYVINGFTRHTESPGWRRGWSARYHPYAAAAAADATSRMGPGGVAPSPSTPYYGVGVNQRAPADAVQSYSLDGAVQHPSITTHDSVQPDCVTYLSNQADCVNAAAYSNSYQMSTARDYFTDF